MRSWKACTVFIVAKYGDKAADHPRRSFYQVIRICFLCISCTCVLKLYSAANLKFQGYTHYESCKLVMVKQQQLGTSLLQRNKRDGSGEWNDEQPTWGARLEWITSHQSTAVDYGLLLHFDGCTADKLSTTYITASGRRSRTLRLKVLLLTPKRLVLHVIKHFVRRRGSFSTS